MSCEQMQTDILIIGGGSAGAMAAIHAKEINPRAKVVIFDKGHIKYSGSIARGMDALNIVTIPDINTPMDYVTSNLKSCQGVADETNSYVMAQRSWELLKKLEKWGVSFPRDKQGNYEQLGLHNERKFAVTMKEPDLKVLLYNRLTQLGCITINRTMAIDLLKQEDKVVGAVGINIRTAEKIVCQAKAVILAAGGQARFGLPNSGYLYGTFDYPGNTGDAYVLAYHAGAELTGMEYLRCSYVIKDVNTPLLNITLTRGAELINSMGEKMDLGHRPMAMMMDEHNKGRGPLRIRTSHLKNEQIEMIEDIMFSTERPILERFFKDRKVDFRHRDIELAPTEFYMCGGHGMAGIAVDENAQTNVLGLYAAGDASNVALGHLTGAFVFGELAVESALQKEIDLSHIDCDIDQVINAFDDKVQKWVDNQGVIGIQELEFKVRRVINDYVVPPKNEFKLLRAKESLDQLQKDLREKISIRSTNDLIKAIEIENIIICALFSASASLERKESRWGMWHYRTDYPSIDNNWEKHMIVKMGEVKEDIQTYSKPVKHISNY